MQCVLCPHGKKLGHSSSLTMHNIASLFSLELIPECGLKNYFKKKKVFKDFSSSIWMLEPD